MIGSVLLWVLASGPSADGPALALRWQAPASCPDHTAMRTMIDSMLGEVDPAERRAVQVDGRIDADAEGYVLQLSIDEGRGGTRELRGASCQELSEAAALVVAMAIDPRLLERLDPEPPIASTVPPEPSDAGTEAEVPPEPSTIEPGAIEPDVDADEERFEGDDASPGDPASVDSPGDSDDARPRSDAREGLAFVGRFDGGVGAGPLPGASPTLAVGLGLAGAAWRVELTGGYWPPRTTTAASDASIGVRAQLWTIGVQGCGEPRVGPVSFPLCAGVLAGAVHAVGVGDLDARRIASRWVAAAIEPGVVWWARPRLGLALRVRGHAALARPALRTEPSGTLFVGDPVGGSLRIGLDVRLP